MNDEDREGIDDTASSAQSARLNEWGVLEGCEQIVLADHPRYFVACTVGEHGGRWYKGIDIMIRGTSVGCGGFCYGPSPERQPGYPTRIAAIAAARSEIERRLRESLRCAEGGPRAVAEYYRRALGEVIRHRQRGESNGLGKS